MKAITISQPFASLIADGKKWVENRTWPTNHRGEIAIHAGKGTQYLDRNELKEHPTGAVVAIAQLVACERLGKIRTLGMSLADQFGAIGESQRTWQEAMLHRHAEGPWCWILEEVKKLDQPILATGKQGLWTWDGGLMQ